MKGTVNLRVKLRNRLDAFSSPGESHSDLVDRILDEVVKYRVMNRPGESKVFIKDFEGWVFSHEG